LADSQGSAAHQKNQNWKIGLELRPPLLKNVSYSTMQAINEEPANQNQEIIARECFRADPCRWHEDYYTKTLDSRCGEVNNKTSVILNYFIFHGKYVGTEGSECT
jgi:hypothetical protein